jgi:peptidyl-prolyl cis-trans isomerase B (cyclophilin B)
MLPLLLILLLGVPHTALSAQRKPAAPVPAAPRAAPAPAPFVNTLAPSELEGKQAVVETSYGVIVIDLLASAAPTHVAHFITRAREGAYDGTTFHRVIPYGLIQGGDPLSKDPAQAARYGTGGLRQVRFEPNSEKHTRGAVAAVLVPGERDSAGNQFFICVSDQPTLDGQFTIFGRVAEGITVAQKISGVPVKDGIPAERIVITKVTIRDRPPVTPEPFSTETVAELATKRVTLETSFGPVTVELFPDRAPAHVRQFLRLAASGAYDGTAFHRVVPGFVIQGGHMPTRNAPLDEKQQAYVRPLPPEFNDTPHELGTLSMARGDDPGSADSSFFIVLDRTPSLDGKYTAFGRVVAGLDVVTKIAGAALDGEAPRARIEIVKATVGP